MSREFLMDCHTQVLEHGLGKPLRVRETVQAAFEKGIFVLCLTDHYPLPPDFVDPTLEKDCAMPMSLYEDQYQKDMKAAAMEFSNKLTILNGAEFDWLPRYEKWILGQQKRWKLDYSLGSVHFLGKIKDERGERNLILDYTEDEFKRGIAYFQGIGNMVTEYYRQVREMVSSGLFDSVAHLDLIKKYNDGSLFSEEDEWYMQEVIKTLMEIKKAGMVLEINSAGWDKKCREQYPSIWILKLAYEMGIGITIGSDAHTPDTIGRNIGKAIRIARDAGYREMAYFRQRKNNIIKI